MAYNCATRLCNVRDGNEKALSPVAMRLRNLWPALLLFILVILVFAWIDGGREEQRMIVEPVELPEAFE